MHIYLRAARTLISLRSNNLIIVLAQIETVLRPSIEVGLHIDTAADTLLLTDRPGHDHLAARSLTLNSQISRAEIGLYSPILLKRLRPVDRRLVVPCRHEHIVRATVRVDRAATGRAAGWVVCAVRFDDVVFNERVAGPAVDGEVAVSLGIEAAAVVDRAARDMKSAWLVSFHMSG